MEDLLASIRKIIADDGADRPRSTLRMTPSLHREPNPPRRAPDTDEGLSALVERSMLDAFGVVDAERAAPEPPRRGRVEPAPDDRDGEAEIAAAVHSIAEAIAVERQGRSRRSGLDVDCGIAGRDRSGMPVGEPDLDTAPLQPARDEPATPAGRGVASKSAAARVASLKARSEAPARNERPDREPAEPLPPNVYRLEPEHRIPEMTDAAVDAKAQDGDGNVFRRQTAARAELDDGLTSARARQDDGLTSVRTRQTVSSQFDQLSRTILTDNPRTLEDLVRDMVRPLLREWLEANLPDIVERQVRQEIDRVSARGR